MITKLEVEISDCPVSGLKRKLVHKNLAIRADLEMIHELEVVYYQNNAGVYGSPIMEAINTDAALTEDQKKKYKQQYFPQAFQVSTKGIKVDPATGAPSPEGIPELQYWQNIPLSDFPDATKASEVVYALMQQSMSVLHTRNRV